MRYYPKLILAFGPNGPKKKSGQCDSKVNIVFWLSLSMNFIKVIYIKALTPVSYREDIIKAVRKAMSVTDIQECCKINVKGTVYIKGQVLALKQDGYQHNIIFGNICLFLCYNEVGIFTLFVILEYEYMPYLRAYRI